MVDVVIEQKTISNKVGNMIKPILWIAFHIGLALIGPIISIWSLNTLFKLNIEYSFWTWLAFAWLQAICFTKIGHSKS